MIAIIGLIVLLVAAGVAVAGVLGNVQPVGSDVVIVGVHLTGMSAGGLLLFGVIVGVAAMFGLSMLLGTFNRRMASRRSRRALRGSQKETTAALRDRDRLSQELEDVSAERPVADHRL